MKNIFKLNYLLYAVLTLFIFTACEEDEAAPEEENEVEVFTDVKLIFMAQSGTGDTVVVAAQDPDGAGVQELQVLGAINLKANTNYFLSMIIENCLEDPCELMNEEIEEEAEEHQFFYAFTNDIFTSPSGNGNIDNASDPINYIDVDGNGNPIGLLSTWNTGSAKSFTIQLQHQPDVKTATSGATDGDTDFALTFNLNIN